MKNYGESYDGGRQINLRVVIEACYNNTYRENLHRSLDGIEFV